MATRTARTAKKAPAAKPAPAPEPEEIEEELDELGDDEEFEELEEAPAAAAPTGKKTRGGSDNVTFGVAHLAEHLTAKTKKQVTTRELRTLIRKMARDGKNRVQREIVAGNRSRYDWPLGLKDPEVKQIIAAYEGGEATEAKVEALTALKERNAAQRAAKKAAAPAPTAKKAAAKKPAPPVEENDDEELDFDDDEE